MRAEEDVPRSAMVLTEDEWTALRGVALFYLEDAGRLADRRAICERIVEATRP